MVDACYQEESDSSFESWVEATCGEEEDSESLTRRVSD